MEDSSCFNKRLYITYEDAKRARNRRSKKAKIALRIYKCPICKGYHLTSKVNSKVMQRKYGK